MLRRLSPIARRPGVPPTSLPGTARDRHWDLLLVCVAVYLATAVGRLHQLFPLLLPLKPALLSAALAIGLYIVQQAGPRRIESVRSSTTTYLLLLLLWVALSVPGALHQGTAFELLSDNFVKTVVLYVLIVGGVRGFRDLERLVFVYFAAAALFAAIVLARFEVGGSQWRLAGLYYYDANDFATFAVTAVPLGIYFAVTPSRLGTRLISVVSLVTLVVAFIWSGSRGGFLAMLAMVAFLLFRYTTLHLRWRLLSAAVITAVCVMTASDRYWTQMTTILHPDKDYNRTSVSGREQVWRRGIGYTLSHPLFGVGGNNFGVAEGTISPRASLQEYGIGVRWSAAHNSFVQVGAELGFPGLLFFIALIMSAFRAVGLAGQASGVLATRQRAPPQLAQALQASLVGFVVGAFFLSLAYSELLYSLVAFVVALQKVLRLQSHAEGRALGRAA